MQVVLKLLKRKLRELIRLFSYDLGATQIGKVSGFNRNTVNRYLRAIRERIAEYCDEQSPLKGEIEIDESFFGPRRMKGKPGRGAYGKTVVFGLLKRQGAVYTKIVSDCTKPTLQAIIRGKVSLESVIHTDGPPIMAWWTLVTRSISECNVEKASLRTAQTTSMESKAFEATQRRG